MTCQPLTVLVTGATGYIGGRLVPRLLAEGHTVRAMTRDASRLRDVRWADQVEVVQADVLAGERLDAALDGVDVAYYLIHSIGEGAEFEQTDRRAATAFGQARAGPGSSGSSTSAVWSRRTSGSHPTWPRGTRWASCCSTAASRRRCCRRR